MNTAAAQKIAIFQALSRIPDTNLDKVKAYLDTLLVDTKVSPPKNQSLKGIWQQMGFENISDLEGELHTVRQELQDAILKRKI